MIKGKRTRVPRTLEATRLPKISLKTDAIFDEFVGERWSDDLSILLDQHNAINGAACMFLANRESQVSPVAFREDLRVAKAKVEQFNLVLKTLPGHLRKSISEYEDAIHSNSELGLLDRALAAIRDMEACLAYIYREESGTGKDVDRAGYSFVRELWAIFEELTGQIPKVGYNEANDDDHSAGPFARFVRSVHQAMLVAIVERRKSDADAGNVWPDVAATHIKEISKLHAHALIRAVAADMPS